MVNGCYKSEEDVWEDKELQEMVTFIYHYGFLQKPGNLKAQSSVDTDKWLVCFLTNYLFTLDGYVDGALELLARHNKSMNSCNILTHIGVMFCCGLSFLSLVHCGHIYAHFIQFQLLRITQGPYILQLALFPAEIFIYRVSLFSTEFSGTHHSICNSHCESRTNVSGNRQW